MRVIYNRSVDPFFNLAAEEYLLERSPDDVFMIWRNDRCVVIGKNQNTWREVDGEYARSAGIAVVRRLTGGGAVFHDLGNVNYTFITPGERIDFAAFAAPMLRALASFGIEASLGGRNDLVVSAKASESEDDREYKISGSAACVRRTPFGARRLHHGTLLYSADLSSMAKVLTPDDEKLRSKGVKSVKSRVANIRPLSPALAGVDAERFAEALAAFCAADPDAPPGDLTEAEKAEIAELADAKYRTWEWNWGTSPAFSVKRRKRFSFGTVSVEFNAERGEIADISITGDFFSENDIGLLCDRLRGVKAKRDAIAPLLSDVGGFIKGMEPDEMCDLIVGASDGQE